MTEISVNGSPVTALIVAAGSGSRMGGDLPKQYRHLGGKAVLAHAVDALASHPKIDAVRVVIGAGQQQHALDVPFLAFIPQFVRCF